MLTLLGVGGGAPNMGENAHFFSRFTPGKLPDPKRHTLGHISRGYVKYQG